MSASGLGAGAHNLLESCAVKTSRVSFISVSCIYGFYTTSICISNYIDNVHLSNIRASRGVPDAFPTIILHSIILLRFVNLALELSNGDLNVSGKLFQVDVDSNRDIREDAQSH